MLALRATLPKTLPPVLRASLAASELVFSLHGLHNYVRVMSGIAWLGANLIVVLALLLALRGRWLTGALACMTYGTRHAHKIAIAVALRLGLDDALDTSMKSSADLVPRLKAMGHYPFNDDFTLGCGGREVRAGVSPGVGFAVVGHVGQGSRVVAMSGHGTTWWLPVRDRDSGEN